MMQSPFERLLYDMAHSERVANDLMLGRRFSFYELRGEIGQGNFSTVRLGIHALTKGLKPFCVFHLIFVFCTQLNTHDKFENPKTQISVSLHAQHFKLTSVAYFVAEMLNMSIFIFLINIILLGSETMMINLLNLLGKFLFLELIRTH